MPEAQTTEKAHALADIRAFDHHRNPTFRGLLSYYKLSATTHALLYIGDQVGRVVDELALRRS